jgi:hypothetical protein
MHIEPRELALASSDKMRSSASGMWEQSLMSSSAVTLCLDGATLIEAELRDVMPTGFRIQYPGTAVPLGMEVVILYPWGKVNALVVSVVRVQMGIEADFLITG